MVKPTLPDAVSRALEDSLLPDTMKAVLRDLTGGDDEARAEAFEAFHDLLNVVESDDDGDADSDDPLLVLRLFPALIGLAGIRDDLERVALLGAAGTLELLRSSGGHEIPGELSLPWEKARLQGLKLLGPVLATPVEPQLLGPLLASVAALQGDSELGALIAGAEQLLGDLEPFDEEGEDDGEDDEEEGEEEEGDEEER